MIKLKNLLMENPDEINGLISNNKVIQLKFGDSDAIAFGMYKGKMYVTKPGGYTHSYIKLNPKYTMENIPINRSGFKYSGRLWLDSKVITFWDYPSKNELKKIIKLLEDELNRKMWNNNWLIEVVIGKNNEKYLNPEYVPDNIESWHDWLNENNKTALVPVTDFDGSLNAIGKNLSHNISPLLKRGKIVPAGVGSKKKIKGAKKSEVPAATRFRQRKGLGDGVVKLKDLLTEGAKENAALDFISDLIKKSKFRGKVFLAGGAVRDELLGMDIKDLDLVVEMSGGGIKFAEWITKKLGIYKKNKNPVVYPKFGTASFNLRGIFYRGYDLSDITIEVVMTRKEQYTRGNRNPDVSAGSLKDDVERRDFTVNSLLKDLSTGEILDLTGMGQSDLKKGIIRTPLNPDVIFSDDPLRMLRAIRFAVKYGWKLPLFMIKSLKRNSHMLKSISTERIMAELTKMMISKYPDKAIRLLQMTELNKYIMPELDQLKGMAQGKQHTKDVMGHTLDVLKNTPPELVTRISALLHDVGKSTTKKVVDNEITFWTHEEVSAKMAEEILRRLKYPNDIIKQVTIAIKNHMRTKGFGKESEVVTDKAIRKLKANLGDHLDTTLVLIHADNISHSDDYNMPLQIPKLRDRLKFLDSEDPSPKLPINGHDIVKYLGIKPGPVIKSLLQAVEDAYFENPKLTKKQAMDIIKRKYEMIK